MPVCTITLLLAAVMVFFPHWLQRGSFNAVLMEQFSFCAKKKMHSKCGHVSV